MTDLEPLIREARELNVEITELTRQKDALIDRIKAELKPGDSLVVDGVPASLRPGNRKFSVKLALSLLPEELRLTCIDTKPRIDEKKVRETVESFGMLDAAMEPAPADKTVLNLTS